MSPSRFWRRAAAYWLVALIIFPFSAPLSVCDLADLAPRTTASTTAPISKTPGRSSVVKDILAQVFPVRTVNNRIKRDTRSMHGLLLTVVIPYSTRSLLRASSHLTHLSCTTTKTILRI
jgi:hypothetical protein